MNNFEKLEAENPNGPLTRGHRIDSAVNCFTSLLRFYGVSTDTTTFRQSLDLKYVDANRDDLVRQARRHGLKARAVDGRSWYQLAATPLPAIASRIDGPHFFIVVRVTEDKALILDGITQKPELLTRDALESIWDGSLILITKRASLSDIGGQFNLGWFMGAVNKYRGLLGEVLIASFMLNVFGLVSPLFFQVVVDKVLVHRDISTLDVLIIGLVAVSIFESVLGGLRTYVFSHTTNRIDVELGARLFRHLLSLPLGYFGARRVGDSNACCSNLILRIGATFAISIGFGTFGRADPLVDRVTAVIDGATYQFDIDEIKTPSKLPTSLSLTKEAKNYTGYLVSSEINIICIDGCSSQLSYQEEILDTPVSAFRLRDNSPDIISIWDSGSAFWVRIYRVGHGMISRVLEEGSVSEPQFKFTKDGSLIVMLSNPDLRPSSKDQLNIQAWQFNGQKYQMVPFD
jgi:hypothetical protein